MGLKKEDRHIVAFKICDEGIDYCFNGYSSWQEIKDDKFHELRLAYIAASKELSDYVYSKGKYAVGS